MSEATMPVGKAEVAAALSGGIFAASLERGAPIAVLAGEPLRLVFATPAAFNLFDVESAAALEAMLIRSESPGARRLRGLAARSVEQPRLEQLRFFARGAPLTVGLVAGRLHSPQGEVWLVVASPIPSPTAEIPIVAPPTPDLLPIPVPFEVAPLDGPVRFLWGSDAEGRVSAAGPELEVRLGPNAPRIGERLADLSVRTGIGLGWTQAVEGRRTFSGLRMEWPEPVGARARVVKISGAPIIKGADNFLGFQGFGVFTGEGIEAAQPKDASESPRAAELPPSEPVLVPVGRMAETTARPGAEIFVLRPPHPPANIVPIRPGALNAVASGQDAANPANPQASVELTSQERDAFREIARALGVRRRNEKAEDKADLTAEASAEAPAPQDADAFDLAALVDALPIGALVIRDDQPLFANRPWLEFAGFQSLDEFREADGLKSMFRGRAPASLIAGGEDTPVIAAGGDVGTSTAGITSADIDATSLSIAVPHPSWFAAQRTTFTADTVFPDALITRDCCAGIRFENSAGSCYWRQSPLMSLMVRLAAAKPSQCLVRPVCSALQMSAGGVSSVEAARAEGLIIRFFREAFSHPDVASGRTHMRAAFYEVYNESVRDLLSGKNGLKPRWNRKLRSFVVDGLFVVGVDLLSDALEIVVEGLRNRATGGHDLNATLSRSHALLNIYFETAAGWLAERCWGRRLCRFSGRQGDLSQTSPDSSAWPRPERVVLHSLRPRGSTRRC